MTQTDLDPVAKLHKDARQAFMELDEGQVRFIVDMYYSLQEQRKALRNQERALTEANEPVTVVQHFGDQVEQLEKQVVPIMNRWTDTQKVGRWSKAQKGIGPVIAAGLLANIDISKAQTAGAIWRYAGLDPTQEWVKGEKRPWNAKLKVLCVRPDQCVTTDRGYIPINMVQVGDLVLTHRGRWKPVTKVYQRWYNGNMYKINSFGSANQGPWVTEGHPMLVRRHPMMSLSSSRWKRSDYTKRRKQWERAEKVRELVAEGKSQRQVAKNMNLSEAGVSLIINSKTHSTEPSRPEVGWSAADQVELGWDVLRPTIPSDTETVKLHFASFTGQRESTPTGSWHPISTVESEHYSGYVYNLEVDEDESYVVEGLASHNCWKIGDSFVKVSNHPDSFYGQLYKSRKEQEVEKNNNLEFASQAEHQLATKNIKSAQLKGWLEQGMLSPAHIDQRAKRYATKIFLSHWFEVAYRDFHGEEPPRPFAIEHLGHAHKIEPPLLDVE